MFAVQASPDVGLDRDGACDGRRACHLERDRRTRRDFYSKRQKPVSSGIARKVTCGFGLEVRARHSYPGSSHPLRRSTDDRAAQHRKQEPCGKRRRGMLNA